MVVGGEIRGRPTRPLRASNESTVRAEASNILHLEASVGEGAPNEGTLKEDPLGLEYKQATADDSSGHSPQPMDYPCTKVAESTVRQLVDPKESPIGAFGGGNVHHGPLAASLVIPTRSQINWNSPVYLHHGKRLYRVRRPQLRLFCLAQVRKALKEGQTLLASIMLAVLSAEGQCRSQDPRRVVGYWELRMQLSDLPQEQIVKEASRFISEASLNHVLSISTQSAVILPAALTPPSARRQETPLESPLTPELASNISLLPARTPELDDEETQRMRAEIDDVIRRTPAIQDTPSKRPPIHLLEKALTAIKETSLFGRDRHRHHADGGETAEGVSKLEGGSAYLYAMITPSKRLRGLLETDVAVSPVRRSKRLLERSNTPKEDLYERIDDIPDISSVGYIPNSHVDVLMHPRKKLFKVDGNNIGDGEDNDDGELDRTDEQECKNSETNL